MKSLNILGIRGLPAQHGGFETFAQNFSLYLRQRGWQVTVYCQHDANSTDCPPDLYEDEWMGVRRVHVAVSGDGPVSTMKFDWRCIRDVVKRPGIDLVLGYNTSVFSLWQRFKGRKVAINMDGIEWRRGKWSLPARCWFYLNEFVGAHVGHATIADHPEIARHQRRHLQYKCDVIPYGSSPIVKASEDYVEALGVKPQGYAVSIARIEPENSILEVVEAFSSKRRHMKLLVLGKLADTNPYHRKVLAAASDQVIFPGAIYETPAVEALRYHCAAYIHGHTVGGTNPSLVEALGAGNAVIAQDNAFNRWVAGPGQHYFRTIGDLSAIFDRIETGELDLLKARRAARLQHSENFTFDKVHAEYENVLERLL
ncbi:glycosyltransferase involved in cell wall biosynthesis [Rhizobium aquaticum]|uniref:Glycosyltransferase involved in cell wall biosynthesis n=1 Tax=Rhizobium aquaticum TaxID=1549636 RepID=A0ABV2J0W7_9HYPH